MRFRGSRLWWAWMNRHHWRDDAWQRLAWALPRRLVYWAAIRLDAAATVETFPDRTPDEVSIVDALKAWDA